MLHWFVRFLSKYMDTIDDTVADPGFFPGGGGGANSPSGCANLFFLAENCMKMKEFWPPGGARVPGAPLDPPLWYKIENKFFT